MNLKACPDCGGDLGRSATKCRCGWLAPGAKKTEEGKAAYMQCAGNPACRFPGRLWIRGLQPQERVCVNHYYLAVDSDPLVAGDEVVPSKMAGISAKPVAG